MLELDSVSSSVLTRSKALRMSAVSGVSALAFFKLSLSGAPINRDVMLRLGGSGGSPDAEFFQGTCSFSVTTGAALPVSGGDDPLDAAGSSVVMASHRLANARKLAVSLLVLRAGGVGGVTVTS